MNKTVTINIGGMVFHIDENAYERIKKYLESIRGHFSTSDGRDEIMQDIEARIAEMFQERISDSKQVITLADVEEVSARMGKPEQFGEEEHKEKEQAASGDKSKRRLFRNPDDRMIGGVCSGVGAYLDLDPIWIRLLFAGAFLFYGSGLLLYFVLWIVIPKAVTTADKLQMKGEPVTIGNIEKNVQEEMNQVKNKFNDLNKSGGAKNFIAKVFDAILQILKLILLLAGKIFAVLFILIGLVILFAMFTSLLAVFRVPGIQYPGILNQFFPQNFQFGLALIAVILVFGIPFLMLAYYGARRLLNIKKSNRIVNMSALVLWLAAVFTSVLMGLSVAKDFSEKSSVRKEIDISQPSAALMHVRLSGVSSGEKEYDKWGEEEQWSGDFNLSLKDGVLQSNNIRLDILKSDNDSFKLAQICYARGSSKKNAADHATQISYSFSQSDSAISFAPYFTIDKNEKFRAQKIQLILYVPVGKKIYLDPSISRIIYDVENTDNILDEDMVSRYWLMTEKGLKCVDCTGNESFIGSGHNSGKDLHHGKVHITDEGVYIKGSGGNSLSIDSNGVIIHKNGKTKIIKDGKVIIESEDDKQW